MLARKPFTPIIPCALAILALGTAGCGGAELDPEARVDPGSIDGARLVSLPGNTHPAATPLNSLGPLEDGFLLEHMQLVLQRSPEREAELEAVIDALHDPASPTFQKWMTADDFGAWGVSAADVATVSRWLESFGLVVDGVPKSRMFIEFSGTAAQVSAAFHTELDAIAVRGERHIANMSDPQIPEELAKVVVGVHALHDFMPRSLRKDRGPVKRDGKTGAWTMSPTNQANQANVANADFTITFPPAKGGTPPATEPDTTGTFYALTPADFATIYNLGPLFAAGITGKGQTVAVIEDTQIKNTSDVATFRTAFGLTAYGGTFTQVTATGKAATCNPSGVVGQAEGEAALDAEWAGATAPGAAIELASCADTNTVFGGLIAIENLLDGATPPQVMSVSYGLCESENGNAANQSYVNTYQQAAAMGVSVYVAAGDEGAASCDADAAFAKGGIAVSGFGSTPYNVSVGGTDFMDTYDQKNGGPALSTYGGATNTATFGSAISYVPEIPWNDSCASELIYATLGYPEGYGTTGACNDKAVQGTYLTTGAGGGGPSTFSKQPTWQTGVIGLPTKSGAARYMPDVSLFAADGVWGHFLVYCMTDTAKMAGGAPCVYTSGADVESLSAGGTSFASPAFAGIQALINQKAGAAQGNPNYAFYKLASIEQGPHGTTRCNSSGGTAGAPVLPHAECVFNDVTQGDIDLPCKGANCFGAAGNGYGALSTSTNALAPAYAAGTGWDFATGLGSVNVTNLVNAWSN
jgi:subtilase family serine protease